MILGVIQARTGSSRLPGKVLMPLIKEISTLELMIKRVSPSKLIDKLIVATSNLSEDDLIEKFCEEL